jgi:hypothetical protein
MGRKALHLATLPLLAAICFAPDAEATQAKLIQPQEFPFEMQFTKGDTRKGAKVRIRVLGDSVHYDRTVYEPGRAAVQSSESAPLDVRRRIALRRIMGDLPRFRVFGSCFGEGMRYYMIDGPAGRFYRSVPERSGRCYTDEPGIWSLLEDLDSFISPPDAAEDDPDRS